MARKNPWNRYSLSVHSGPTPNSPEVGRIDDYDSRRAAAVDGKRILREADPKATITEFWKYKSGKVAPAKRTVEGFSDAVKDEARDGRMNKYPRVEGYRVGDGNGSVWVTPAGQKAPKVGGKLKPAGTYKPVAALENSGRKRRKNGKPSLINYQTGAYIRRATAHELVASKTAAKHDGGAGVIRVRGVACFVQE